MILKVVIIDDEPAGISEMESMVYATPGVEWVASFSNVSEALAFLNVNGIIELIFSDIEMPGIDGIAAAHLLSGYCKFLTYVTAHRHYSQQALDEYASGYLLKPLEPLRFIDHVETLRRKNNSFLKLYRKEPEFIFVKGDSKNSIIKVAIREIMYIRGMLNYVSIYTLKGSVITYISLLGVQQKLSAQPEFYRIGKSTIISLNFLESIDGHLAFMSDRSAFPIGEKYRAIVQELLTKRGINLTG